MRAAVVLRLPSRDLVGRVSDLRAVGERLAEGARIVTLVGPPGIGKTRLARELIARHEGPTLFCDAQVAREPADLAEIVARGLELPADPEPGTDRVERVGRALAARGPMLLVLDALERCAERAAATVASWVEAAPELTVLVTSRIALRVRAEHRYPVEPLSTERPQRGGATALSDAATLFVNRASAVRGKRYDPSPAEIGDIEEVVRKLEGIPLAVELAAARMLALGTKDLRARIVRQLDLLGHGPRDAAERHATLRAAIDWSWELLSGAERAALAQLSAFAGGFDLDAVEAVVDLSEHGAPWTLEVLDELAEASVLIVSDAAPGSAERRFRLYESVREFAAEQLDDDRAEELHRRHAAHYVERGEKWAAQLHGPEGPEALECLTRERDNLVEVIHRRLGPDPRTAARALLALSASVEARGGATAWVGWTDRCLAALGHAEPVLEARLLCARATVAAMRGDHRPADRDLQQALAIFRAHDEHRLLSQAALVRCRVSWRLAEVDRAEELAREALAASREAHDRSLEGDSLRLTGTLLAYAGNLPAAIEHFEQSVAIHDANGDALSKGVSLDRLGEAEHVLGRRDAARNHWAQALQAHKAAGNRRWEAVTRTYLAELCAEEGDLEIGRAHLQEALRAYREVGDRAAGGVLLVQLGVFAFAEGQVADAGDRFATALAAARAAGHEQHSALTRGYRGAVAVVLGRDGAARDLDAAATFFERVGNRAIEALFRGWAAVLASLSESGPELRERFAEAARIAEESRSSTIQQAVAVQSAFIELAEARAAGARGDWPTHRAHVERVEQRIGEIRQASQICLDARAALLFLESRVGEARSAGQQPLAIDREAEWFRVPGGETIDVSRRQAARHILRELVEARTRAPGEPVDHQRLVEVGWPGERILERAASNRLRVTISALRKAGLGTLVQTLEDGYRLDPDVPIEVVERP